jgi:Excalibur calcium-binding domain
MNVVRISLTLAALFLLGVLALATFASASSGAVGLAKVSSPNAGAAMPRLYRSCKNFNARYPHGVGRLLARDKVQPGNEPVRNFRRSNRLFRIAMSYNKGLDRDKDRIACEKH